MRKTEQIIKELELLEFEQEHQERVGQPRDVSIKRQAWIDALKWVLTISPLGREHEWNHRSELVR